MSDRNLTDFILIHDNKGNMVSSLEMTNVVVGLEFLENQQLLIVLQKGTYFTFNPLSKMLSQKFQVGNEADFDRDPILIAKATGNNFIYLTHSCQVYIKEIGGKSNRYKLYMPESENTLGENAINFSILHSQAHNQPIQVFVPTLNGGVLRIYHSSVPKVERVVSTVTEQIVMTSISPCGQNLAVLTKSGMLVVISIKNPSNEWRKKLDIDEGELGFLNKLEWVSFYAVALVFRKKIKLACCGLKEMYFEIKDEISTSYRTNYIITRSEIDGLRVIRVFENYHKQHCSIVRRLPQAYISARLSFSTQSSPGKLLLDLYMATLHGNPLEEDDDIRQFKPQLVDAVTELIECGCFELDVVDHSINIGQTGRVTESCCVWQEVSHQR